MTQADLHKYTDRIFKVIEDQEWTPARKQNNTVLYTGILRIVHEIYLAARKEPT